MSRIHRGWLAAIALCAAGCHTDMYNQPRYDPLEGSEFFPDMRSARPRVAGTIARGHLPADVTRETGRKGDKFVERLPLEVTPALLKRGQERFQIYCTPCHSRIGDGNGIVVLRGYRRPPTFHSDRLRGLPDGQIFDTITRGFGVMPSYAHQVPVDDRWAIIGYMRVLQLSQYAPLDDLPDEDRAKLPAEEHK
jgi:cbb3-type cytochrome c oxidase subunit III